MAEAITLIHYGSSLPGNHSTKLWEKSFISFGVNNTKRRACELILKWKYTTQTLVCVRIRYKYIRCIFHWKLLWEITFKSHEIFKETSEMFITLFTGRPCVVIEVNSMQNSIKVYNISTPPKPQGFHVHRKEKWPMRMKTLTNIGRASNSRRRRHISRSPEIQLILQARV